MNVENIIENIIKVGHINLITYFIFLKIINDKSSNIKTTIMIIASLLEEALSLILVQYLPRLPLMILTYCLHGFIISKLTNQKIKKTIVITFISVTIAYLIYMMSIVISAIGLKIFYKDFEDSIIILFTGICLEYLIIYRLFKIKRFENGITFLKNENYIDNIGSVELIFVGISLIIYSIIPTATNVGIMLIGLAIEAICLFIWIKKKITKYYKQKLKEQTVADLQNEIKEKDSKINEILEENKAIATINHKYSSRIKALEEFTSKITSKPELLEKMKTEFGEDYTAFEEQIKKLSKEYSNEIKTKITKENNIPKTGIFGIDALLEHMSTEATNSNIHIDIKINASINYMVEKIISESALETLLGDHIKDAIIAINSCNNTNRRILVVISIIDKCYEISFYDTGIEFEINTLIKLGKEQITTHKETGGSGIGFMTTFETLSKTKGSLIIEEKHPMNNTDYTKAIKIKFDNKNEYRIKSYRAEEIKKQRTDIIIEK